MLTTNKYSATMCRQLKRLWPTAAIHSMFSKLYSSYYSGLSQASSAEQPMQPGPVFVHVVKVIVPVLFTPRVWCAIYQCYCYHIIHTNEI